MELCATQKATKQFKCLVEINRETLPAMVDSGATGNFVCPETAEYRNFKTQKKRRPYRLGLIDGTNTISEEGWVTTETLPLRMKINDYKE